MRISRNWGAISRNWGENLSYCEGACHIVRVKKRKNFLIFTIKHIQVYYRIKMLFLSNLS